MIFIEYLDNLIKQEETKINQYETTIRNKDLWEDERLARGWIYHKEKQELLINIREKYLEEDRD